jgi:hypothetical protein
MKPVETARTPDVDAYRDLPNFIYSIKQGIRGDQGIRTRIKRCYADGNLVWAATELTSDNTGMRVQTLQTLHHFPHRQLVGEGVIWSRYEDGSFMSPHCQISVMRH